MANETYELEETLGDIGTEAKSATLFYIILSTLFQMNMQAIWGGINAV